MTYLVHMHSIRGDVTFSWNDDANHCLSSGLHRKTRPRPTKTGGPRLCPHASCHRRCIPGNAPFLTTGDADSGTGPDDRGITTRRSVDRQPALPAPALAPSDSAA